MVLECQACGYVHETSEKLLKETAELSEKNSHLSKWVCPICGVGSEFQEEITSSID